MLGTLADKFRAAGVAKGEINKFDVFTLADNIIVFPEERLGQKRKQHEKRFVIVLQNDIDNHNPIIKVCTIAPLSSGKQYYRLDYLLKKTEHTFLREDSYIRMGHIQPVLKVDLKTKWGNIADAAARQLIQDRLFSFYALEK